MGLGDDVRPGMADIAHVGGARCRVPITCISRVTRRFCCGGIRALSGKVSGSSRTVPGNHTAATKQSARTLTPDFPPARVHFGGEVAADRTRNFRLRSRCSAVDDAARDDPSSSVTLPTAASSVTEQPTTIPATPSKTVPTIASAPEVVDTVGEPVPPEAATVRSDGAISWKFTPALIDRRARRYVLDPPPDGFDVTLEYEATSSSPVARAMTGIFATGSAVDPFVTVTITTPPGTGATPTLNRVKGEPTSVGDAPAVRRTLGVNRVGTAFVVGAYRIDVVATGAAETWLAPLAASVEIDGSFVSVRAPAGSGLKFIGAFSPQTAVADGFDLIDLYHQAQVTSVRYSGGKEQVGLVVTTGRVVGVESLHAWLEPRAEPIEVAGLPGWIVRVPNAGFTIVGWMADGRMFQLGGDVPEKELLALSAGVRPATTDEWSQLAT